MRAFLYMSGPPLAWFYALSYRFACIRFVRENICSVSVCVMVCARVNWFSHTYKWVRLYMISSVYLCVLLSRFCFAVFVKCLCFCVVFVWVHPCRTLCVEFVWFPCECILNVPGGAMPRIQDEGWVAPVQNNCGPTNAEWVWIYERKIECGRIKAEVSVALPKQNRMWSHHAESAFLAYWWRVLSATKECCLNTGEK